MSKKSYEVVSQEVNDLYAKGEFSQAIELINASMEEYPEHYNDMNLDLAVLNLSLGSVEKTLSILNAQLDRGVWYPYVYFEEYWNKDEFKAFVSRWQKAWEQAQGEAKKKLLVFTPQGYVEGNKYPLFIALHGWGEDVEMFKAFWDSKKLDSEYIVVLLQSSQMVGSSNYCWNDVELGHKEIEDTYKEMISKFNIDKENIMIGGFSQGATMALDAALNKNYMPSKGFISLNPDKPEEFDKLTIMEANKRGLKGVILTGDQDGSYKAQLEMINTFKEVGFKCNLVVKENFGHWFPEDLGERIDSALDFILE